MKQNFLYYCSVIQTQYTMKKYFLLFVLAFAASAMQAQNNDLYSLMFHEQGDYDYCIMGLMQQGDGDFIINTYLVEDTGNFNYIYLGYMAYKVESANLTVTDSLFIPDTIMSPPCSFVQNPHGEGNIRASVEFREDCDSSFLHISLFPDNDFNIYPDEDVVAPLCEGFVSGFRSIVDCRGDLILQYDKERDALHSDEYVARFGLDGTMKCQTLLNENSLWAASQLRVLKESPLKYYQWAYAETNNQGYDNLIVYVIDSLFNKSPVIISSLLSEEEIDLYTTVYEHINLDGDTEVISIDGDNVLVAAKYVKDTTWHALTSEFGVVVAKYDIRTMQPKGYIVFNDYLGHYNNAQCYGIKMMTDGTVYFLYHEHGYPTESVVIVKMDTDLNVIWKRFCKTNNIYMGTFYGGSVLYKDEQGEEKGIAWLGEGTDTNTNKVGWDLFLLNHDGTVGINESGIEVRPYAYYPNPARDQLHMEFSPDVQPAQVELYDLQGRLVRTQSKAFESIDMSQLPAGTYTMRVIMEDGMVYSDKVVKE